MKTILKHKTDCNIFVKIQEVDRDMIYGHAMVIKRGNSNTTPFYGSYIKSGLFCICNQGSLHVAYRIPYTNEIFRLSLAIIYNKIGE